MLLSLLTPLASLALLSLALPAAPPTVVVEDDVAQLYQQYHAAEDSEALGKLWGEHPDEILYTIDADLEASLAAWEADPENADQEHIAMLQARARWGAAIASKVTGDAIFADYAAAFAGWNDEQKKSFREGQAAFGRSREQLVKGEAVGALNEAVACRELAEPLGDWWGTAMGLSIEGKMLAALERFEEALVPLSRARLIYNELGLVGAEYGVLLDLSVSLQSTGRWERVLVVADAIVALSGRFNHDEGRTMAEGLIAEALAALGREG